MPPFLAIRTQVFDMSQKEFADLLGVAQGTVSRWERPIDNEMVLLPDYADLMKIRDAAKRRGLQWHDSWFWEGEPYRRKVGTDKSEPERRVRKRRTVAAKRHKQNSRIHRSVRQAQR